MNQNFKNIFVSFGGRVFGPYDAQSVRNMGFPPDSMVKVGMANWMPIASWMQMSVQSPIPVSHEPFNIAGNAMSPMPGQPRMTPRMPGQPINVMPAQPVNAMPAQPVNAMPGQPVNAMSAQPVNVMPGQPVNVMPGQPVNVMPGQPAAIMNSGVPVQGSTGKPNTKPKVRSTINPSLLNPEVPREDYVICPNCGTPFERAGILYIAEHTDLADDTIIREGQRRFLPTKFNAQGFAIDEMGMVCKDMACPHCHLRIPESCTVLPGDTFSIAGAPGCGKSYYLATMVWQLRNILAKKFDFSLVDADEEFNSVLNEYERRLFLSRERDVPVSLEKTEQTGVGFSNELEIDGVAINLPRPFIFTLTPSVSDPQNEQRTARNVIFYDNAGEHFEPGQDNSRNLATQHLIHSNCVSFLFDPMQDTRFAKYCNPDDPQLAAGEKKINQMVMLNEMLSRIRKHCGLDPREKCNKNLIVILPKYDAWQDALKIDLRKTKFTYYSRSKMQNFLDVGTITSVSFQLRELLKTLIPELVSTAENFFEYVYFVPISSLGTTPLAIGKQIAIRPADISPIWVEVPMLLQLYYANIIQAVDVCPYKNKGVSPASFRFSDRAMIYSLPDSDERDVIPLNYCGFTVFSAKKNTWINLPDASLTADEAKISDALDENFWNEQEI